MGSVGSRKLNLVLVMYCVAHCIPLISIVLHCTHFYPFITIPDFSSQQPGRPERTGCVHKMTNLKTNLASVAKASERTFSMRLEPSPHTKRLKVNALPKVVGFLRALRFPPTGKADRVG